MNPIITVLLFGFLFAADYTLSKHPPIHLDLEPDRKLRREVIYFDKIEFGEDGYRIISQDSVVNYYKGKREVTYGRD